MLDNIELGEDWTPPAEEKDPPVLVVPKEVRFRHPLDGPDMHLDESFECEEEE